MHQQWLTTLADALQRPTTDPLVQQLAALLAQVQAGTLSAAQANQTLRDQAGASGAPLLSFAGAQIEGNLTLRDVAGRDLISITMLQMPLALPQAAPFAVRGTPKPLFGRDTALDTVRTRLCAAPPMRLGLSGLPGVGKTHFTVALAHDPQLQAHFAGGVFHASLGERPGLPSVLGFWAAHATTSLDPNRSPTEQATQLFAALHQAGQPFLVVLDDIWDAADARALLPTSPHANVLLTSRQRELLLANNLLGGPADHMVLESLDSAAAVAMLQALIGLPAKANTSELAALFELTGGLPLLLGAIGSHLREQRQGQQDGWFMSGLGALQQAATRLGLPARAIEQTERNLRTGWLDKLRRQPVQALSTNTVLKLSIALLPHDARQALVRLAALPPDPLTFGLDAAQAAIGDAPEAALRQLVARSFVSEAGDSRFRLHRVLWDWAEANSYREVHDARRSVGAWHSRLLSFSEDTIEAFEAWRQHPDNWQHVLTSWRASLGDLELLRAALRVFVPRLITHAYWNDLRPGLLEALQQHGRHDKALEATLCYYLADVDYYRAEYASTWEYGQRALRGFEQTNSTDGQAGAHAILGLVAEQTGDYASAQSHFEAALALTSQTNSTGYATSLTNLAVLHRDQGDYAAARPLCERALAIREQALGPHHPDTKRLRENLDYMEQRAASSETNQADSRIE